MHPSVYDHMSVAALFFYLFISETVGKQDLCERIVKIPSAQILFSGSVSVLQCTRQMRQNYTAKNYSARQRFMTS